MAKRFEVIWCGSEWRVFDKETDRARKITTEPVWSENGETPIWQDDEAFGPTIEREMNDNVDNTLDAYFWPE